jgi:hypothetical protein
MKIPAFLVSFVSILLGAVGAGMTLTLLLLWTTLAISTLGGEETLKRTATASPSTTLLLLALVHLATPILGGYLGFLWAKLRKTHKPQSKKLSKPQKIFLVGAPLLVPVVFLLLLATLFILGATPPEIKTQPNSPQPDPRILLE